MRKQDNSISLTETEIADFATRALNLIGCVHNGVLDLGEKGTGVLVECELARCRGIGVVGVGDGQSERVVVEANLNV